MKLISGLSKRLLRGRFKFLAYLALLALAFLIQTSIFPLLPFLGATPNLLLILTFSVSFIHGSEKGMFFGLLTGLLLDMFYSGPFGFYSLIYVIIAYINGRFHHVYYEEYITVPLVLCTLSSLLYHSYIYIFRFLIRAKYDVLYYLWHIVLPSVIFSLLVTLLVYKFFFSFMKKLDA